MGTDLLLEGKGGTPAAGVVCEGVGSAMDIATAAQGGGGGTGFGLTESDWARM
jgi:hypothetical protein